MRKRDQTEAYTALQAQANRMKLRVTSASHVQQPSLLSDYMVSLLRLSAKVGCSCFVEESREVKLAAVSHKLSGQDPMKPEYNVWPTGEMQVNAWLNTPQRIGAMRGSALRILSYLSIVGKS